MEYFKLFAVLIVVSSVVVNGEEKELKIETITKAEKCDRKSKKDDFIKVHYTGTLEKNGEQFDSSLTRHEPFEFQLGKGEVIKGWDQGLLNMCVGEKRKLTVPPSLGYGQQGAGKAIPGGATLIFEIELLSVEDAPKPNNVFKEIDTNGDGLLSQDEVREHMKREYGETIKNSGDNAEHFLEEMTSGFVEMHDKNKDGRIAVGELTAPDYTFTSDPDLHKYYRDEL